MKNLSMLKILFSFFTGVAMLACLCSNPADLSGGGGSEVVVGKMAYQDNRPAAGATIYIRPSIYTPVFGSAKHTQAFDTVDSVKTDAEGKFGIDSINAGSYILECLDQNGKGGITRLDIVDTSEQTDLGTKILKPFGSLKGTVSLVQGGNVREVPVFLKGLDRFAIPDTLGMFQFDSLPEGTYQVQLTPLLDNYTTLDTGVVVISLHTTDLDTLQPKFIGIPVPSGISLLYDTLPQQVTLSWKRADTSLVNGYIVYRGIDTSILVQINNTPILDTFFSTEIINGDFAKNKTYTYRVACLDKNDNKGKNSENVSVKTVSTFPLVDSLVLPDSFASLSQFLKPMGGKFYLFSRGLGAPDVPVSVFDLNCTPINSFVCRNAGKPATSFPNFLSMGAADSSGNLYFLQVEYLTSLPAGPAVSRIRKYSATTGDSLRAWAVDFGNDSLRTAYEIHIDVHNNIYILGRHYSLNPLLGCIDRFICKFDTTKTVQDTSAFFVFPADDGTWLDNSDGLPRLFQDNTATTKMSVLSADLQLLKNIYFGGGAPFAGGAPEHVDAQGRYYVKYIYDQELFYNPNSVRKVFSENGEFIAQYQWFPGRIIKITDMIYTLIGNKIYQYKMPW